MKVDIYLKEKCSRCGDVGDVLDQHDVEYDMYFMPPSDSDIEELDYPITEPVLVDEDRAPNGIVGHEEIIEWVIENYR